MNITFNWIGDASVGRYFFGVLIASSEYDLATANGDLEPRDDLNMSILAPKRQKDAARRS